MGKCLYFCSVVPPGVREGKGVGDREFKKKEDVVDSVYLRLVESGKFANLPHGKSMLRRP